MLKNITQPRSVVSLSFEAYDWIFVICKRMKDANWTDFCPANDPGCQIYYMSLSLLFLLPFLPRERLLASPPWALISLIYHCKKLLFLTLPYLKLLDASFYAAVSLSTNAAKVKQPPMSYGLLAWLGLFENAGRLIAVADEFAIATISQYIALLRILPLLIFVYVFLCDLFMQPYFFCTNS